MLPAAGGTLRGSEFGIILKTSFYQVLAAFVPGNVEFLLRSPAFQNRNKS